MTQQRRRSRFSSTVTNSGDVSRSRDSGSALDTLPLPTPALGVGLTGDGWTQSGVPRDWTRWRFKSGRVVAAPVTPSAVGAPTLQSIAVSFRSTTACPPTLRPDLSDAGLVVGLLSDLEGTSFGSVGRRALRSGFVDDGLAMSRPLSAAGGVTFTWNIATNTDLWQAVFTLGRRVGHGLDYELLSFLLSIPGLPQLNVSIKIVGGTYRPSIRVRFNTTYLWI